MINPSMKLKIKRKMMLKEMKYMESFHMKKHLMVYKYYVIIVKFDGRILYISIYQPSCTYRPRLCYALLLLDAHVQLLDYT